MIARTLAGLLVAATIAVFARSTRSLTTSGALAAGVIGTLAVAAGWSFGAVLIAFFATSSALSRWRRTLREARITGAIAKSGARDATQVFANGGVFALFCLAGLVAPHRLDLCFVAASGALAAATSDTWATEIGTVAGGAPRSILTGRSLGPGMSGGITIAGTLAAVAGALCIAAIALALPPRTPVRAALAIAAGGIAGSTTDSLLGAALQARRWCPACARQTERSIHDCGTPTEAAGGVSWMGNDLVNFACTLVGGLFALLVAD